jgi:hypothetical protein
MEHLDDVLVAWLDVLDRYSATESGDCPYWYNERAAVSSLGAAAWHAGGIALEEYSARKGGPAGSEGRADLWIKVNGTTFSLEAKQLFRSFRGPKLGATCHKWLRRAVSDAKLVDRREAKYRSGVLFVTPYVKPSLSDDFSCRQFVERLRTDVPHDFASWWFQPRAKLWPWSKDWEQYYPGVVMLGRFL